MTDTPAAEKAPQTAAEHEQLVDENENDNVQGSPEITTPDIYRPTKSANSRDSANFSLSDKDKTLYVSELDPAVNEADLFKIFNSYGSVLSIRVVKDTVTKNSLGYAYVNYKNKEDGKSIYPLSQVTLVY